MSSTGKSTLARHLSSLLKLPVCSAGMRDVYKRRQDAGRTDPIFSELPIDLKVVFQIEAIEKRLKQEADTMSFIADGTPIDFLAFWIEWTTQYDIFSRCAGLSSHSLAKDLEESIGTYDVIFRLPYGVIPTEDDNRRIINQRFLRKMSLIMDGLAFQHAGHTKFVNILSTEVPRRIDEVMMKLADMGFVNH